MKYYNLKTIDNLIQRYIEKGGKVVEIEEGTLGYGTLVLYNNGDKTLKEFIVKEKFLNEWSSGHTVRAYKNGLPKKYLDRIGE